MRRNTFFITISIAIALSLLLSYSAYFVTQPVSGFNPYQALASLIFWLATFFLLIQYPLKGVSNAFFSRTNRSPFGLAVFASYISVHLVVYGFILEGIVATLLPASYAFPVAYSSVISAFPLYPPSALNSLLSFFFYPSIAITIPPIFGLSLSLFSVVMAFLIAMLVVTNITKARELKNACTFRRKSTVFFVLPAIGVIGGASCCLSLPLFIAFLAAPAVVLSSPSMIAAYYVTYFLFPPATVVVLKLNLDSINRLFAKISAQNKTLPKLSRNDSPS